MPRSPICVRIPLPLTPLALVVAKKRYASTQQASKRRNRVGSLVPGYDATGPISLKRARAGSTTIIMLWLSVPEVNVPNCIWRELQIFYGEQANNIFHFLIKAEKYQSVFSDDPFCTQTSTALCKTSHPSDPLW